MMAKIQMFLKTRWGILLTAVCELAVGILLLVDHVGFTDIIFAAAGVGLLVVAIIWGVTYFRNEVTSLKSEKHYLAWALSALAGGLVLLLGRGSIAGFFPALTMVYGVFLLEHSFYSVQMTVDMYRLKMKSWVMSAVVSGIMLVLSLLVLMNPFGSGDAIWTMAGISYIATAVMNLLLLYMRAKDKQNENVATVKVPVNASEPTKTETPEPEAVK